VILRLTRLSERSAAKAVAQTGYFVFQGWKMGTWPQASEVWFVLCVKEPIVWLGATNRAIAARFRGNCPE
jgi:hypothetical protein